MFSSCDAWPSLVVLPKRTFVFLLVLWAFGFCGGFQRRSQIPERDRAGRLFNMGVGAGVKEGAEEAEKGVEVRVVAGVVFFNLAKCLCPNFKTSGVDGVGGGGLFWRIS